MVYEFNHKEKYLYDTYFNFSRGASVKPVPFEKYKPVTDFTSDLIEPVSNQKLRVDQFVNSVENPDSAAGVDDIFHQKLSLTQDRTYLIINEILEKEALHKQNLTRLYDDLLMIDNWRIQRPYPQNYSKDKTWMDFNKMELQVRDQIRREIKDSMISVSFNEKDLREALLDFKKQSQKNQMMESMLEDTVNENQGGEYSTKTIAGDLYRI